LFNIIEMLAEKIDFIDAAIMEVDTQGVHSILSLPTKYAISSGGKHLRPIICTLSAEVVGGDYRKTSDAFLALELIHNGTLVHDDILDDDLFRRGRPATHLKFGGKTAILAGDALLSLGLKYAAKTKETSVVDWLSGTALKILQGVALQTFYRRKFVPEEEYLMINYLKSGSLFEASAALGGIMGATDPESIKELAEFGRYFGNAYQIRDDICGVFSENKDDDLSRNDLINGDISLPLIYALESESIRNVDKQTLISIYLGETDKTDIEEVQEIYEETGALDRSVEKMKKFAELGRSHLGRFETTEAKQFLHHLIKEYYNGFTPGLAPRIII
jgi:geranylgeranyl pyrophosphate synthase